MPYHIYGCDCGNLWIYNTKKQQQTTLCTQCRTTYALEKREPLAITDGHNQAIQARGKLLADRQGHELPDYNTVNNPTRFAPTRTFISNVRSLTLF